MFQKMNTEVCTHNVNPIAPRKAKIVYNFGLSECNKVKERFSEYCDASKV